MIYDIYSTLFQKVLYPAWEGRLRGRPTLAHLAWLEKTQWRPLDELQALQDAALKKLLHHAYENVPFYRARMQSAGVHPSEIRGARDLSRIPILTRSESRESGEARKSTAPPLPTVMKSTSGTMRQPLQFGYDAGSEYWRQAVKLRGYGWAGYRLGEPTLHYWGAQAGGTPSRKIRADRFLRRETYLNCTMRGEADLQAAVEAIRRVK